MRIIVKKKENITYTTTVKVKEPCCNVMKECLDDGVQNRHTKLFCLDNDGLSMPTRTSHSSVYNHPTEYRYLSYAAILTSNSSSTFIVICQVGVQIARITFPSWHFFSCSANLT